MTEFVRISPFLRWILLADAATSGAIGLLMMFGSGLLEQLLELPPSLTRTAGISLLPFAAFLVYLAARQYLSSSALWLVIVINVLWTLGSILLLIEEAIEPNGLGYAFVLFQAVGVAIFAVLEYVALRKSAVTVQ